MTNKITIQNKLKYIFGNNIIHNIDLLFKKACFSHSHISFIKKSISNFIACRDSDKGYLLLKCTSCEHSHKNPLHVNPNFVLLMASNILLLGLRKFPVISLNDLTDMFFSLFLGNAENSSF